MKFGKAFLAFAAFLFFFGHAEIRAQNSEAPKRVRILNNFGKTPFEDGKTIIDEVVFAGLDSESEQYDEAHGKRIYESEFRLQLRVGQTSIFADEALSGAKVSKVVKLLRKWLASRGYEQAEVTAFGEMLPQNRMRLVFEVKRGRLAHVSEIRFDGNLNVSEEELVADLKRCLGDAWLEPDRRYYDYCARKSSLGVIFARGYLKARVGEIIWQLDDGNYTVTVPVSEGARYRLGEIKIEGARAFSEKEILEMFEVKTGDVFDGKSLQNFVYEKLKKAYEDRGYILFDAELDLEFQESAAAGIDASADLSIKIDEGNLFRLAKIEFPGLDQKESEELKKLIPLREGEIFSRSKIEEGIKKINERGEFYPVEYDGLGVEMRTEIESEDAGEKPTLRGRQTVGETAEKLDLGDLYLVIKLRKKTE